MVGKVLIVEDESKIRTLLKLYLERNNYVVKEATNGKDVLALVEKYHPDVIVLDILMPNKTGVEVCKKIRKHPDYYKIPIIFLSSLNQKASIIEGLEAGGDDYMTKPFDPNELVARINAVIRRTSNQVRGGIVLYETLSEQEMNVLQLMDQGYTNKEIASELYLTEGTVKVYSHHIYQKLQVRNRTQAIVKAKEAAII